MTQLILSGIVTGSAYALLAMSFNIIFRVAHVVNFAQGELMTAAALITYSGVVLWGWPIIPSAALGLVASVMLAMVIERVAVRPVVASGRPRRHNYNWILSTFGASVLLQNVYQQVWGSRELKAPALFGEDVLRVVGAGVSYQDIGIVLASLGIFVALQLINERTLFGRSSEAVAEKAEVASLMGIDSQRIITKSWMLAGLIAGITGILVAPVLVLSASMGFFIAIKAFIAMIVGGLGNPRGAVIAGAILGVYETILTQWISGGYVDMITFGVLVLVLYFRPSGVFTKGEVVRV